MAKKIRFRNKLLDKYQKRKAYSFLKVCENGRERVSSSQNRQKENYLLYQGCL